MKNWEEEIKEIDESYRWENETKPAITQPFHHKQAVTQGQFLNLFEFKVFLLLD